MESVTRVRAVHHGGVLKLLEPVELPEGAEVQVLVLSVSDAAEAAAAGHTFPLVYPTRRVSADTLDNLVGVVSIGGDALADSEALYD